MAAARNSKGVLMSLSPTQRTIRELKNQGRSYGIVERFVQRPWQPHGIRIDLFGFLDLLVLDAERGIVGVQCCGSDFAAHYRKITEDCAEMAMEWLYCGGKIELWGWRLLKQKRGGKAVRWTPRIKDITLADFSESETTIKQTSAGA